MHQRRRPPEGSRRRERDHDRGVHQFWTATRCSEAAGTTESARPSVLSWLRWLITALVSVGYSICGWPEASAACDHFVLVDALEILARDAGSKVMCKVMREAAGDPVKRVAARVERCGGANEVRLPFVAALRGDDRRASGPR